VYLWLRPYPSGAPDGWKKEAGEYQSVVSGEGKDAAGSTWIILASRNPFHATAVKPQSTSPPQVAKDSLN